MHEREGEQKKQRQKTPCKQAAAPSVNAFKIRLKTFLFDSA